MVKEYFSNNIKKMVENYDFFDKIITDISNKFAEMDSSGIGSESIKKIIDEVMKLIKAVDDKKSLQPSKKSILTLDKCIASLKECQQGLIKLFATGEHQNIDDAVTGSFLYTTADFLSKQSQCDYDKLFESTKRLSEISCDYYLQKKCLELTKTWAYGSENFAMLDAEEKLTLAINKAIVADRMNCSHKGLYSLINALNSQLENFSHVNWQVYYAAGILNFKIHEYNNARKWFSKIQEDVKHLEENRYFHAKLLISYSYEYEKNFEKAIESLYKNPEELLRLLDNFKMSEIVEFEDGIQRRLRECADESSLFHEYFKKNDMPIFDEMEIIDSEHEERREIIHALAHCLNEYSVSVNRNGNNDKNVSRVAMLARKLMKNLSNVSSEYGSCYATIHGEHQDFEKALRVLKNIRCNENMNETLDAEITFYEYYFKQMLNRPACEKEEKFKKYAEKYSDNDAECHIVIFSFRKALKDFAHELFNSLNNEEPFNGPSEDLKNKYEALCLLTPTLYMNANVRDELKILKSIYISLCCFSDYIRFGHNEIKYEIKLNNALKSFRRFAKIKEELGIIDCLKKMIETIEYNSSIFILAPISGVIAFQYQTGEMNKLFNVEEIVPVSLPISTQRKLISNHEAYNAYADCINEVFCLDINDSDWTSLMNKLGTQEFVVYYWEHEYIDTLLIIESENGQPSQYSRKLLDGEGFKGHLNSIQNSARCRQESKKNCAGNLFNKSTLGWLEVVSKHDTNWNYFVYNNSSSERAVIIAAKKDYSNKPKGFFCDIHAITKRIEKKLIQTERMPEDEPELQASEECMALNDASRSSLSNILTQLYVEAKNKEQKKEEANADSIREMYSKALEIIKELILDIETVLDTSRNSREILKKYGGVRKLIDAALGVIK